MASGRSPTLSTPAAMAALLLASVLAGCMGGGGAPDAGSETQAAALQPGQIAADESVAEALLDPTVVPRWNVGDAWTITSHGFGAEEQSTLVVTAVSSDAYTLASTSEQTAGFDAMFDVSYLGAIRASDLAGSQQGSPVQYFSWPLADGKAWTASWDGYEVALTATKATDGRFMIVGTVDGEDYVHFDYDPALKWWSHLEFVRDGYGFEVNGFETGWTGEVATAVAEEVYSASTGAPVASPNTGSFTISEGQSFAMVTLQGGGAQWARAFYLFDPSGAPYSTTSMGNVEADGAGMQIFLQEQIPATPGEWRVASPAVHDPSGGFTLTVHQVAIAKAQVGS